LFGETPDTIFEEALTADEDGEFSIELQLPENASEGLYTVTVLSGEKQAEAGFNVVGEDAEEEEEVEADEEEETEETEEPEDEIEENEETEEEETEDEIEEDEADEEEEEDEVEDETEDTVEQLSNELVGLESAIQRAEGFIAKIRETMNNLLANGYTLTDKEIGWINDNLSASEDLLAEAKGLLELDGFHPSEAAKLKAEARRIMGRTMGYMHKAAKKLKEDRAQEFIGNVEDGINSLQEKIAKLEERLEQGDIVQAALEAKLRLLERLRERLEAGEVDEVVEELEEVVEDIDEDLDDLDDEETAERFKAMNRVGARIRVLTRMAQRLGDRGENTTEIDEQVASAEGLMAELMNRMQEGGDGELNDLLESAEEGLTDLGTWIRGLRKPEKAEA
jgi:DNA repair exonuclease SbcCD ATPase subunit